MLLLYELGNVFYEFGRLEGIGESSFVFSVFRGIFLGRLRDFGKDSCIFICTVSDCSILVWMEMCFVNLAN